MKHRHRPIKSFWYEWCRICNAHRTHDGQFHGAWNLSTVKR